MEPCKILIIDDDDEDVEILADAFKECGVDGVQHVHSAMQAFMYLEKMKDDCLPKLIITDLYLRGISGDEFLKDLKQMEIYKDIPVVVLSSVKSDAQIEAVRNFGAVDFLVKPNTYSEYLKVAEDIKAKI